MQAFMSGENLISVERKYIDVPLSAITSTALVSGSIRPSLPVQELGNQLLELAKKGDAEGVRECMSKGAPFSTDWLGTSPLHFAAQYNHCETVEMLLKAGISRDTRNKVERTPLHVAAQEGNFEILKLLIDHGSDVDCKDMLRMTPLHWAAENGHADCVRLLLDFGADPLVINKFDKTPDNIAYENDRLDIVEMLQEAASLDPLSRKVLKERDLDSMMDCNTMDSLHQIDLSPDLDCVQANDKGTLLKGNKIVGRRKVQHISRTLPYKVNDENELPPTPPVEDLTSYSDNEEELIEIARGQQQQRNVTEPTRSTAASSTTKTTTTTSSSTNNALQMLQAHGITMLPMDESSIVESAVQSGQTVILTEAGKLALNLTKNNQLPNGNANSNSVNKIGNGTGPAVSNNNNKTIKRVMFSKHLGITSLTPQGKRVITIRADQLINMTREKKVIIHTGDKKLGRPAQFVRTKPLDQTLAAKLGNITTINTCNRLSLPGTPAKKQTTTGEMTEVETLKRQLEEAKRQIEVYKEQLKLKEREAEHYRLEMESYLESNKVT